MPMPAQKPGQSRQDWQTPPELLAAVKRRLHITDFGLDVAATKENAVCPKYYSLDEGINGLEHSWLVEGGWTWCNPPYGDIGPWVNTAALEAHGIGTHVCMLVPAAVGANWWRDWVQKYAYVLHLNGRVKFVGAKDYYPKDCSILLYTPWRARGSEVWKWR